MIDKELLENIERRTCGFVYAIRCGHWLVKIGKATDLAKRLSGIAGSNPFEFFVEDCLSVPYDTLTEVEGRLHQILKKDRRHVRNEWFAMTTPTLHRLFDQMVDEFENVSIANDAIGLRRGSKPGDRGYRYRFARPDSKMEAAIIEPEQLQRLKKERRREEHEEGKRLYQELMAGEQ